MPDPMPELGVVELLAAAYRRATLDGAESVGSDRLIYEVARQPRIGLGMLGKSLAAAGGQLGSSNADNRLGRTRDRSGIDPETTWLLREIAWRALRGSRSAPTSRSLPVWEIDVVAALQDAEQIAERGGRRAYSARHVLLAALGDPGSGAYRFVEASQLEVPTVVDVLRHDSERHRADLPWLPALAVIEGFGVSSAKVPWIIRIIPWFMDRAFRGRTPYGNAMLACIEEEAMRQAVRFGHSFIGPAHLLLALLAVDDQMRVGGVAMPARLGTRNDGAMVLRESGLTYGALAPAVAHHTGGLGPFGDEDTADEWLRKRFTSGRRRGDPAWSRAAVEVIGNACAHAAKRRDPDAGTTHLLVVIMSDPESATPRLVAQLGSDPMAIRRSAAERLT